MKRIGIVLLAAALALPASAQIIIGGKTVTDPNTPTSAPAITAQIITTSGGPLLNLDAPDFKPLAIALPALATSSDAEAQVAAKILDLINKDLASSGDFKPLDPSSFASEQVSVSAAPAYANWTGFGAQALLVGKVMVSGSSLTVQFRLFDTAGGRQLAGTQYTMPSSNAWPRLAHKIADDIYSNLAGTKGYFDSRILFVADSGPKAKLGLMDQDGANTSFPLTDTPSLQAPRFSPSSRMIVYSVNAPAKSGASQLTTGLYDLETGQRAQMVAGSPQPNPDARFSPDSKTIAYTRNETGSPDIFLFDIAKHSDAQLSKSPEAESGPTFSPDGAKLAFATAQGLVVMRADGQQAASISSGGYRNPTWSPAGDWIAFEQVDGKSSSIGVMKSDGSGKRMLTQGPADTSPAWSPNGRVLVFARKDGASSKLWTIEVSGRNLRALPTSGNAAQPDWGPKLP